MPNCYHCGQPFDWSENPDPVTGKKLKIDKSTERPHQCAGNPQDKYRDAIHIKTEDGREFNAKPCLYACGQYLYKDDRAPNMPKLFEMSSAQFHNFRRCYLIHLRDNMPFKNEHEQIFKPHFEQSLSWSEMKVVYKKEELETILKGMSPDSRLTQYMTEDERKLVGQIREQDLEELHKIHFSPVHYASKQEEEKPTINNNNDKEKDRQKTIGEKD